jgi:hypothetical protein
MAIVQAFEEWRPELEGALHPIQVLSDHKNLEYFMSTKLLNRRQTCWAEYLSRFDFKIIYCPGKAGKKPDALTRRSEDLPQGGDEYLTKQQKAVLMPQNVPDNLHLLADTPPGNGQLPLDEDISEATKTDAFAQDILTMLREGKQHCRELSLSECQEQDGRLLYQQRLYIAESDPLRLRILRSHHDLPTAGHPGRTKTFHLIKR